MLGAAGECRNFGEEGVHAKQVICLTPWNPCELITSYFNWFIWLGSGWHENNVNPGKRPGFCLLLLHLWVLVLLGCWPILFSLKFHLSSLASRSSLKLPLPCLHCALPQHMCCSGDKFVPPHPLQMQLKRTRSCLTTAPVIWGKTHPGTEGNLAEPCWC